MFLLRELNFRDYTSLYGHCINYVVDNKNSEVAFITKKWEVNKIVRELMLYGYDTLMFEMYPETEYNDDYYLTVTNNGIKCVKIKADSGEYIKQHPYVLYVSENAQAKALKNISGDVTYIFSVDDNCADIN